MKSILVGKLHHSKVYYVVDAHDNKSDCVLVDQFGDVKTTNFWEFVDWNPNMTEVNNSDFHEELWNGHQKSAGPYWYSVFVQKSVPISQSLLENVYVKEDIMKRRHKTHDYENRAMDFRASLASQEPSQKVMSQWINKKNIGRRTEHGNRNDQ